MEPMFLPGVEHNPQPGSWTDGIRMMQAAGAEYPQIWHMFAFKPEATTHLARFTQEIMREPAPLTSGASGADRGVYVGSQSLSVLTEVARRGRGGSVGAGSWESGDGTPDWGETLVEGCFGIWKAPRCTRRRRRCCASSIA